MIALELLVAAPDRQCAELCALAAFDAGVRPELIRAAWDAWQNRHAAAVMRGEEVAA